MSADDDFVRSCGLEEKIYPPPVDPAQAPTNISSTNIICENDGHKLKSAVANPVVVIIEAT